MAESREPTTGGRRPGAMTMAMKAVPVKPTGLRVLRIGVFKDKKVIEERIIRKRETVSIGTSEKNHMILHVEGLPARFELFQLVGRDYILNFTKAMTGKVGLPGGVQRLEQLRASGGARDAGTHHQIKLSDSSRGNIVIGDVTVFFEFVVPPPITPKPQLPAAAQGGLVKSIDWTFTTFVVLAYMLFFGFIIYMENADWAIEDEQKALNELLAQPIFVEPEPPPVDETPTETGEAKDKKPSKADAKPAEDKKADAKDDPAVSAEARARIADEAAAQAETMLLGALSTEGGALADVLAGGAVTGNAADVLANASGVGVATSGSGGVLRERGGGNGSGAGGLGTLKAGKGAGKGVKEGAAVAERRIKGRVNLNTGGDVGGSGEFDSKLVVSQIKKRLRAIQTCYEKELRKNPSLKGKVTVQFTIQERGNVTGAKATQNTTGSPAVADCVVGKIRGFRFNPGPVGGSVSFSYPFVFQTQN